MKTRREIILLKLLMKYNGYLRSEEICNELNISSRTLRNDIKNYNSFFLNNGVKIISKHGNGYSIDIIDEKRYYEFLQNMMKKEKESQRLLPVYPEDRINYLVRLFLSNMEYVKLDDIADELYLSRATLSNDLKEVRQRLSYFHIELISKPSHGLKIEGSEMHIRSCIAQYFYHTETIDEKQKNIKLSNSSQEKIKDILFVVLDKAEFRLTDIGFQNLIIHISIAIARSDDNEFQDDMKYNDLKEKKEYAIAKEIINRVEQAFDIVLKKDEINYVTIHLLGKKTLQYSNSYAITEQVESILNVILNEIKREYDFDFRSDFELYTLLALHMQPMLDRLEYGLSMQNPLLNDIKKENALAFEVAVTAANVIKQNLDYTLDEAEIGYLALHFALAIERLQQQQAVKKNIIIVCASGMGSSQILLHKIKQRFHNSLNKVAVTELYKLKSINLEEYDLVLTTVKIPFSISIPVILVQYFLNGNDVIKVTEALKGEDDFAFINQYFSEDLFFCDLQAKNKKEIIHEMTNRIREFKKLPDEFEDLILKRESLAATEFGNMVAMPHPMKPVSKETFIAVGILNKAVKWLNKDVKYIFLISVKKDSNETLGILHETLASFVNEKALLTELGKNASLSKLKELLKKIAYKQKENDIDNIFK